MTEAETEAMTRPTTGTAARDDLFTHIHKALRLALFDHTVRAGRTDWTNAAQVADLLERWRPLVALLRAHTAHEEEHILRLLDPYDPVAAARTGDEHGDLDDLLDDLDAQLGALASSADAPSNATNRGAAGLAYYRDMTRFVAAYLPHLHDEETRIMARIWACCSDAEIAEARRRFMAATSPEVMATTLRCMLPALDPATRSGLIANLSAAPPAVLAGALAIADEVLSAREAADLRAAVPLGVPA